MYAVANDNFYIADMLLYYEVNPNLIDNEGNTAILLAAYYGNVENFKLLQKSGADITATDNNGNSVFHKAIENYQYEMLNYLTSIQLNIDFHNKQGINPLAMASKKGYLEIVKLLVQKGANVNYPDIESNKPLFQAQYNNHHSVVKFLKASGAKVNWKPIYNVFSIANVNQLNSDTYTTGLSMALNEIKYNSHIALEFRVRPTTNKILYKKTEDYFYQYWERRYFIAGEIGKNYVLIMKDNKEYGFYTDLKIDYSFGTFTGTKQKPDPLITFSPSAGYHFSNQIFMFDLGYLYQNLNNYNFSKHYLQAKITYIINQRTKKERIQYLYE